MLDPNILADEIRLLHREQYRQAELAGTKKPFLVPLVFVGYHIIPTLYLAIPHKNRPWLYQARWLVLALTTYLNLRLILETSSINIVTSYAAGLIGAWAIIWNLTLLVWTRPQWEAKRIRRLVKGQQADLAGLVEPEAGANGHAPANGVEAAKAATGAEAPKTNGSAWDSVRQRRSEGCVADPRAVVEESGPSHQASDVVSDSAQEQDLVYVWQEYPEHGSFVDRLDWAFALVGCFRLTGWNWAIKVLPPSGPPPFHAGQQLPLSALENTSRYGYTRQTTLRALLLNRTLLYILPGYLIFDLCATLATQDPFFILGRPYLDQHRPLPPSLAALHPVLLSMYRSAIGFLGILTGLSMTYNLAAVLLALLAPPLLGFRAHPWHLPSMNGSFLAVLDHGLAGFWGSFWHQTFRFGFEAPTRWLVREARLQRGTPAAGLVGALVAFGLSGLVHASGSYSTIPPTRPWAPPAFFLLAGVGTVLQQAVARALRPRSAAVPRWLRRLANLLVTAAWLHLTCGLLLDDFARSGLFLYEPVPFSVARYLGFGIPGDRWYRWDLRGTLKWHVGERWWEVGVSA